MDKKRTFIRSQISSFLSTLVDFGLTIFLKEFLGWWYLTGTITGTLAGGLTNFELGRHWVFKATGTHYFKQARRYILVWAGSLFLNVVLVYLFTSVGHFHYLISKVIVACMLSVIFNYVLQRIFVFRRS